MRERYIKHKKDIKTLDRQTSPLSIIHKLQQVRSDQNLNKGRLHRGHFFNMLLLFNSKKFHLKKKQKQ